MLAQIIFRENSDIVNSKEKDIKLVEIKNIKLKRIMKQIRCLI